MTLTSSRTSFCPSLVRGRKQRAIPKNSGFPIYIKACGLLQSLFVFVLHIGSDETLDDKDKEGMVPILYQQVGAFCVSRDAIQEQGARRSFSRLIAPKSFPKINIMASWVTREDAKLFSD
jgi:hypothetical protein